MRSTDPTLPSITFVLSQAQPASSRSGSKRWNRFGVRRSKSSPSFAPHPPRYPPRLDSEFLTTVDYRFSSPPQPSPRARSPSRSSLALPKDIFDADAAEIEIVMAPSSPTESESSTTESSTVGCSSHSHHDGSRHHESLCCGPGNGSGSSRRRARAAVTGFIHDAVAAFRSRIPGMQTVRRAEKRIPFDLLN